MKTKPCEYCHRLPLHAGGCSSECIINGRFGKSIFALEIMKMQIKLLKDKGLM